MDNLIFWISLFSQAMTLVMMIFFAVIIYAFRNDILRKLADCRNNHDNELNKLKRNENHFI